MTKPRLLVIYHLFPDTTNYKIIEPEDETYESWERAHGILINSNDDDADEDVISLLENGIGGEDVFEAKPLILSGDFKIIHCGFIS